MTDAEKTETRLQAAKVYLDALAQEQKRLDAIAEQDGNFPDFASLLDIPDITLML